MTSMTSLPLVLRGVCRPVGQLTLRWMVPLALLGASVAAGAQTLAPATPPRGTAPPRPATFDPGPRPGSGTVGGPLPGLTGAESNFFFAALARFQEIDSVSGTIPGEDGVGLGPRFNMNGCAGCHAHPAAGGSSPASNPQVAVATLHGAQNTVPSFITADGPVREARFVKTPSGAPDGGVHDLFVITGRSDAPGCRIVQPDFAAALAANNVAFRIPTPMFGLGLVEATPYDHLVAAVNAVAAVKTSLGIAGHFNTSGNDGTITRFGWKAQNKSLLIFAGEAYNVEQGVTNEVFPDERETAAGCQFNGSPEDGTVLANAANAQSPASAHASDTVNFATLFRYSAPPVPATPTAATTHGGSLFLSVGCQGCHIPAQMTGASTTAALSNVTYRPFSDFAVHDMGDALADGITQGSAGGREFRTAPLWGVGQRLFFLHDGRTSDLAAAIAAHASPGSEANAVIANYNRLTPADQADLLAFLRSL